MIKNNKGMTLVELICAIILLMLVITGFSTFLVRSMLWAARAENQTQNYTAARRASDNVLSGRTIDPADPLDAAFLGAGGDVSPPASGTWMTLVYDPAAGVPGASTPMPVRNHFAIKYAGYAVHDVAGDSELGIRVNQGVTGDLVYHVFVKP